MLDTIYETEMALRGLDQASGLQSLTLRNYRVHELSLQQAALEMQGQPDRSTERFFQMLQRLRKTA